MASSVAQAAIPQLQGPTHPLSSNIVSNLRHSVETFVQQDRQRAQTSQCAAPQGVQPPPPVILTPDMCRLLLSAVTNNATFGDLSSPAVTSSLSSHGRTCDASNAGPTRVGGDSNFPMLLGPLDSVQCSHLSATPPSSSASTSSSFVGGDQGDEVRAFIVGSPSSRLVAWFFMRTHVLCWTHGRKHLPSLQRFAFFFFVCQLFEKISK